MTRIIAGRFKGRRLQVPAGRDVRPTTDRMRERLFSILSHGSYPAFDGSRVMDLFAGTGALGLEALSRGAAHVTFVEKSRPSLDCLRANIDALGVRDETDIMVADARRLPAAPAACDFIFMDPPYRQGLVHDTLERLAAVGWLAPDGVVVCELASDESVDLPPCFRELDVRSQGQQKILILAFEATEQT